MLLKTIHINHKNEDQYPFNLNLFKQNIKLDFDKKVTIIVGENGSGKSSLLKLIQNRINKNVFHLMLK